MPRTGRVILPNYPHHIVHYGHNGQTVFHHADDYQYYLANLAEYKAHYQVRVYAFCLMGDHVHLLLEPHSADSVGKLMKRLAGRQTRKYNQLEGRRGTLWEGRYRSSPVQADKYLLSCCRYIELNPVRAHIVSEPDSYAWSSCCQRFRPDCYPWLDLDTDYLALDDHDNGRQRLYHEYLKQPIPSHESGCIEMAVERNQLTGTRGFVDEVEEMIGRRIELRGRGRPRVHKSSK